MKGKNIIADQTEWIHDLVCFLQEDIDQCLFYGTKANRIAPDETLQNAASHLGLSCLLRRISSKNGIEIQNHP